MTIKEKIYCRFCNFYSSEKPGNLVTIFLILQGGAGFLYSQKIQTFIISQQTLLFIVIGSWAAALLFTLPRLVLWIKGYSSIRLFQHLHTGILTDLRFRINQIAIRVRTFNIILDDFSHASSIDDVYKCGEHAGKDFIDEFIAEIEATGTDFNNLSLDKKIHEWLKYDSTVGFGKLQLKEIQHQEKTFVCKIEFKSVNRHASFLRFFEGYLTGACYEIYGEQVDMISKMTSTPEGRIFEISAVTA